MPKAYARKRHIIPISGKDSLCTALVQMARDDSLPYEFVFCDVGMELPEIYKWLDSVEKSLGITIIRLGKSLREVIAHHNMLPSHQRRFCTREGKIEPLEEFIGDDDVVQYMGIRADEDRAGAGSFSGRSIEFKYPLVEAGIDLPGVYAILEAKNLLPPDFFWQTLYEAVVWRLSDDQRSWVDQAPRWVRSHLFSGRSRSNCFQCFYQRMYEWVWLLEVHPDLYQEAEQIEWKYGSQESLPVLQADFRWRPDMSLGALRANAGWIFHKRVMKVLKEIQDRFFSPEPNLIELTSCGLLCGK